MTNRTTTMIALGLILAMGSVPPAEAGKQLDCSDEDAGDDGGGGGIQLSTGPLLDTKSTADLAKPVRDCLGEPCDEGTVGIAGVCIQEPDVRLDPCPADTIGTAGVCIDRPQEKECDEGQISLLFACMNEYGLPPLPETEDCPAPSKGLVVNGKEYCVDGEGVPSPGSGDPQRPECSKTDDDVWPGGSHVKCTYACPSGSALAISVKASDLDAKVTGDTACADKTAHCSFPGPHCEGLSQGITAEAGDFAECHGYTDEANSSPVQVACSSISVQQPVGPALCLLYPPLCTMAQVGVSWVDVCGELVPQGAHAPLVASLAGMAPGTASGVVFEAHADGVWFVAYSALSGTPMCTLGRA